MDLETRQLMLELENRIALENAQEAYYYSVDKQIYNNQYTNLVQPEANLFYLAPTRTNVIDNQVVMNASQQFYTNLQSILPDSDIQQLAVLFDGSEITVLNRHFKTFVSNIKDLKFTDLNELYDYMIIFIDKIN